MSTGLPLQLHATERADRVREHTSRRVQTDLDVDVRAAADADPEALVHRVLEAVTR